MRIDLIHITLLDGRIHLVAKCIQFETILLIFLVQVF